ncbi:hypothetical protein [Pseudomonas sp. NPDC087336]|jgi:hypothetical protein|uniref:hypothetical protein n=1 Tax=Pseudomonas sp. NPDC087336 TaxID=3364436 RepID=UPI003805A9EA
MSSSDLGIMIISLIGLFGFASFIFEYFSSNRSTKNQKAEIPHRKATKRKPIKEKCPLLNDHP